MPSSWGHWCGTGAFGRRIFSRIGYGARPVLVIGVPWSFVGPTMGAILGVASAYFGGRIDDWIQRVMDVLLAFPIIVLALVVVFAFKAAIGFVVDINLIFAIAIPILPRVERVVRATAVTERHMPYRDSVR